MLRFARTSRPWFVMAGRGDEASLRADVPAIHVLGAASKCVDTRHKAGHDGVEKRCVTYGVWRPHPSRGWYSGQQTSSWSGEATKLRFAPTSRPWFVMAGLVPAIHVLGAASKCVDTRHKAGHDGVEGVVTRSAFTRVGSLPCSVMAGRGDDASLRADVPAVVRHGRARRRSFASRRRPGHPRALVPRARTWMPGTRPGMTVLRSGASLTECGVRILREVGTPVSKRRHGRARRRSFASRRRPGHPRALVPRARTWMPGTRPGMTVLR